MRVRPDELLSYLRVASPAGLPAPLSRPKIVFIAHSTGGLVVRYLLERHHDLFRDKVVCLVLLASPSRGSAWSNRLKWLREFFGNRMAGQLAGDNDFVQELDSRFANFIHQKRLRWLTGIDFFEHKFVIKGFFFNTEHVVSASDSASYFGAFRIVPETDHFSIAKPTSMSHPSHQMLLDSYETRFKPMVSEQLAKVEKPVVSPPPMIVQPAQVFNTDQLRQAEALAESWLDASARRDFHALQFVARFPFYVSENVSRGTEGKLLPSFEDLRGVMARSRRFLRPLNSHKANTVAEWKRLKATSRLERLFGVMAVHDSDVVVMPVDTGPLAVNGASVLMRLERDGWKVRAYF